MQDVLVTYTRLPKLSQFRHQNDRGAVMPWCFSARVVRSVSFFSDPLAALPDSGELYPGAG